MARLFFLLGLYSKYYNSLMPLLLHIGRRLVTLHVLVVALLLPTLHLHPHVDHEHAVAHADFFPGAHHRENREQHHDDDYVFDSQITFAGVVSRWVSTPSDYFRVDVPDLIAHQPIDLSANPVYSSRTKAERAPPILDDLRHFLSSRAPPPLFVL